MGGESVMVRNLVALCACLSVTAACKSSVGSDCCVDGGMRDGGSAGGRIDAGDGATGEIDADGATGEDAGRDRAEQPQAELLFETEAAPSCNMASPIVHELIDGRVEILSVAVDGLIRAFEAGSGDERWRARLTAPEGQTPIVLATPALVGDTLFLAWQNATTEDGPPDHVTWDRQSHVVEAFDLVKHEVDPRWPRFTLSAERPAYDGGTVEFDSRFQLLRSEVQHVEVGDRDDGLLYVSVGNGPSVQPFHGWVFELDLDAWRQAGTSMAVSGVLLTTASNDCTPDASASNAMVCGGGVWTPSGALITQGEEGDYEIIVPTGNGRVDFDRDAYAHSVMRTGRRLSFDSGCDETLCAPFDELSPDRDCLESCEDIFTARMPPGEQLMPDHSLCEGMTFLECYGHLDADLGSSAPVEVQMPEGPRVFVHPGKDGGLYLFDAAHMGTLYDRAQALPMCGTDDEPCPALWTGQFVTTPVVTTVDGDPVVIVSGFNYDSVHPAGVVAYSVILKDGAPALEKLWQTPDPESAEATRMFRYHTGRPALFEFGGETYVIVVEPGYDGGYLWIIRARDGDVTQRLALNSDGLKFTKPAIVDDTLFIGTCDYGALENGRIEAFRIVAATGASRDEPADADGGMPMDGGMAMDGGPPICEPGGLSCGDDEYCERDWCGGPGLCRPRPESCDMSGPGVCGCDGQRYDSECEAHAAGVTVDPDDGCSG